MLPIFILMHAFFPLCKFWAFLLLLSIISQFLFLFFIIVYEPVHNALIDDTIL